MAIIALLPEQLVINLSFIFAGINYYEYYIILYCTFDLILRLLTSCQLLIIILHTVQCRTYYVCELKHSG